MNYADKTAYSELLKRYNSQTAIPYYELLLTNQWDEKRNHILKRDGTACLNCGKTETEYIAGLGNIWLHIEEKTETAFFKDGDGFKEEEVTSEIIFHETSDKPYHLHVHHCYYVLSNLPWEYPDEALKTLCNWCHWKFHEENKVPVYETIEKLKNLAYQPCIRCNGAGWFPEYKHVQSGECFRCKGLKYEELIKTVL